MTYYDRLHPWCIIRLLPQMQRTVVRRFRQRNEAEAHLRALQRLTPDAEYAIVFDPPDLQPDPPAESDSLELSENLIDQKLWRLSNS